MLSSTDFSKKQFICAFLNQGDKLNFQNDNLIIKDKNKKIKYQVSCYRLFLVIIIGDTSITTGLIKRSKNFGFAIAFLTHSFRLYQIIGLKNEGNILLRLKQYQYQKWDIAKLLIKNKIYNQRSLLIKERNKSEKLKSVINEIDFFYAKIDSCKTLEEIMGNEGAVSKIYFKNYFNDINWILRQPRIKNDMTNSLLDIGYTLLFTFIETLLCIYGFDIYYGVMHRLFYMRKSLVCDLVEPFRFLIDEQIRKSINLKQFKEDDFIIDNHKYLLKWEKSPDYTYTLLKPILDNKELIFKYIQEYYRAFMSNKEINEYPWFELN